MWCGRVARQADVLPDLQEQVDGGIPVGAVRGGALQRDAVDLLRAAQIRRVPAHHRQRRRLRHRDYLHNHVPRLRSQEGQAVHGHDHAAPERGRVRAHRAPHDAPRRRREARRPPRLGLRRVRRQRLRRPAQHHPTGGAHEERRVHALLPLLLPHRQRRRLVPLRPPHQGQIRRPTECHRLHLWGHPDGPARSLPQRDAQQGASSKGGRRRQGGDGGGRYLQGARARRNHRQARGAGAGRGGQQGQRGAPGGVPADRGSY